MNDLITINYDTDQPTVSARDLHKGLEITERYSKWFDRMKGYGFEEGEDYTPYQKVHPQNLQEYEDHKLSIDMAKQICMIQRSDKGKQYRQYLIDLEKAWNTPEQVMARALRLADQKIEALKNNNVALLADVERMKPKADYVDSILSAPGTVTTSQIAADYGISARKLNKILHEAKIQRCVGTQWILYKKHMGKGYAKSETVYFKHSNGRPDVKMFTKWTQKGRLMINDVLNSQGIYADMDTIDSRMA